MPSIVTRACRLHSFRQAADLGLGSQEHAAVGHGGRGLGWLAQVGAAEKLILPPGSQHDRLAVGRQSQQAVSQADGRPEVLAAHTPGIQRLVRGKVNASDRAAFVP